MPTIKASQKVDTSRLEPVEAGAVSANVSVPPPPSPFGVSPFFQHSLPAISAGLDQYTRQFYGVNGLMPQRRTVPMPAVAATTGAKGDAGATGAAGATLIQKVKTGVLSRTDIPLAVAFAGSSQVIGTVHLGRTFELLKVATDSAVRVRLYSSTALRDADLARDVNTAPTRYTAHGLIFDLNADATYAFPLAWKCSPTAPGADLNTNAAGDIAYTLDTYQSATGSGFVSLGIPPAQIYFGGIEVARGVAVTPGWIIRAVVENGLSTFFVDGSDNVISVLGDSGGASATYTVTVPAGAAKIITYTGLGGYYGGGFHNYSSYSSILSMTVAKATVITNPTAALMFTVLTEEQ